MPTTLWACTAALFITLSLSGCGSIDGGGDSSKGSDRGSANQRGPGILRALPVDGPMPLVRTDFSDDAAWQRVVSAVTAASNVDTDDPEAEGDYLPNIEPLDDRAFEGATGESLAALAGGETYGYVILADARSMRESAGDGLTVALVDLSVAPEDAEEFGWVLGREFRADVKEVASIEANLAIANMDFDEFADAVASDGVFRGFE